MLGDNLQNVAFSAKIPQDVKLLIEPLLFQRISKYCFRIALKNNSRVDMLINSLVDFAVSARG